LTPVSVPNRGFKANAVADCSYYDAGTKFVVDNVTNENLSSFEIAHAFYLRRRLLEPLNGISDWYHREPKLSDPGITLDEVVIPTLRKDSGTAMRFARSQDRT